MEHARKYALVPEDMMSQHIPDLNHMSELDKKMLHILKSKVSDHEKVKQYYSILQHKLNLESNNPPWKTITKEEEEETSQEIKDQDMKKEHSIAEDYSNTILSAVPPNMKRQASTLLNILKAHPSTIRWNDKGELYLKDLKYSNSNIADLFNLIFISHKSKDLPAKEEFLQALQELNVPKHLIKNKQIHTRKQESIMKQETKQKRKSNVSIKWDSFNKKKR